MVNFYKIVERIKGNEGLSNDKDIAELFGISPPDFSKRKKRGTLLDLIVEWGISKKVNLGWLITGEGEMYGGKEITASAVNLGALGQIIEAVEEQLLILKLKLCPHKKAELITLLYEHFTEAKKEVDRGTVVKYLRLVA